MEIIYNTMADALSAIEQLSSSGNLSVETIFDVVAKTSAGFESAPSDAVYLLYNGKDWEDDLNSGPRYATWDLVNDMVRDGGGKVFSVNQSAAGELLNDQVYFAAYLRQAIAKTIDPSLPSEVRDGLIEAQYEFIKSAKVRDGNGGWERNGTSGSLWDLVSQKYIQENDGDFRMIMQNTPDPLSVFVKTEIDAFLAHPGSNSTLNGMSKQDLIAMDSYWANREKLIDLITVQSYSYATLTDLRKSNVDGYLSFDFSSPEAIKASMQNLPEGKCAELIDRVNALPADFRERIIGVGDNLIDYLDNVPETSAKAITGIGAILGTTFLIASGIKINDQVQAGDNQGAINTLKDLLISLTAESVVEVGVAAIAAPVFAAIEGAAISVGLKYTLRLTLGLGLGLVFGDKVENILQLMRDKNENGRMDIADKLAGLLFGEGTTQISVQKDILAGETLAFDYQVDPAKILELAKADISWRYSLREMIPFVLTDIDYDKFNQDASLELYNPLTGEGVLSEDYLRDRAYALYAYTKYWNQKDSDGQWSSQPLIEYAGSNILFPLIHLYLKTQTGETFNLPFLAQWGDLIISDASLEEGQQLVKDGWDLGVVEPNYLRFGHEGSDSLSGGSKDDRLYGMEGNDVLYGGGGNDYLEGGIGGDFLHGGDNDDYMAGMAGDDHLHGEGGDDYLAGGKGIDTFYFNADDGHDRILDANNEDRIVVNGVTLSSMKRIYDGANVFTDGNNQFIYTPGEGLLIKIAGSDGDTVRIYDWDKEFSNFGILIEEYSESAPITPDATIFSVGSGELGEGETVGRTAEDRLDASRGQDYINELSIQYDAAEYAPNSYVGNTNEFGFAINVFDGGSKNDTLNGSATGDDIDGRGGDDTISAGAGTDWNMLQGNIGNDVVSGGQGTDFIYGNTFEKLDNNLAANVGYVKDDQEGKDILFGLESDDSISGDEGDDYIDGGIDNDILTGGEGADSVFGGQGNDFILGDASLDMHFVLDESMGIVGVTNNVIFESSTNANIDYDDVLDGGVGSDKIFGEMGNDFIAGGAGDDLVYGDREVTYSQFHVEGQPEETYVALDPNSHGNDVILGGEGNDEIRGGGGSDDISGGQGADTIWGDDSYLPGEYQAADFIQGGEGVDTLIGGGGDDSVEGGTENDVIYGDESVYPQNPEIPVLDGSYHGKDSLSGDEGDDIIVGGGKADYIQGGDGADNLFGDVRHYGDGSVTDSLEAIYHGDDVMDGGAGNDVLYGDGGADTLLGGVGNDYLSGGTGSDRLEGGDGVDSMLGGTGNDLLLGGAGNDYLDGGEGDDTYVFTAEHGADTIVDASGKHKLVLANTTNAGDINIVQNSENTLIWVGTDSSNAIVFSNASFARLAEIQLGNGVLVERIKIQLAPGSASVTTPIISSLVVLPAETQDLVVNNDAQGAHTLVVTSNKDASSIGWGFSSSGDVERYDPNGVLPAVVAFDGLGKLDIVVMPDWDGDGNPDGVRINLGGFIVESSNSGIGGSQVNRIDVAPVAIDGTLGQDSLAGNEKDNVIRGFAGNDSISGSSGNDVMDGGAGADQFWGGSGNDAFYLDGGLDALADMAYDYSGSDRYYIAGVAGKNVVGDTPDGTRQQDQVVLSNVNLSDVTFSRPVGTNDLVVSTGQSAEFLTIKYFFVGRLDNDYSIGEIRFANGEVIGSQYFDENFESIWVGSGDDVVYSGSDQAWDETVSTYEGSDTIYLSGGIDVDTGTGDDRIAVVFGYEGDSVLRLGQGDDVLFEGSYSYKPYGGGNSEFRSEYLAGSITYRMSANDGNDSIGLWGSGQAGDVYTLELDDTVSVSDVNFRLVLDNSSAPNLVVSFGSASITFVDKDVDAGFASAQLFYGANQWAFNQVRFADGTVWNMDDIQTRIHTTTDRDNVLNGSATDDTLSGAGGNDLVYGRDGNDTLIGGAGDDALYGGAGNDTYVVDGQGVDLVVDTAGDNLVSFNGNLLGEATRTAEGIYVDQFGNQYQIVSADQISGNYYGDLETSGGEITGDNNLLITYGNTGVVLRNWDKDLNNFGISLLAPVVPAPVENPVNANGTDLADVIFGSNYADAINAQSGQDTIYGFGGNDSLAGGDGDDVLIGGTGDDSMAGSAGSDKYVISLGDGADTVSDTRAATDSNVIEFGAGIAKEDIAFSKSGDGRDLVIAVGSSGQSVTIQNFYGSDYDPANPSISEIRFANGDAWNKAYLVSIIPGDRTEMSDLVFGSTGADNLDALAGNDTVYANAGDDIVSGGAGNDELYGEAGNDTLIGGTGSDLVKGGEGNDVFVFGNGSGDDFVEGGQGADSLVINGLSVSGDMQETGYQTGIYTDTNGNRYSLNEQGQLVVSFGAAEQAATVTILDWNESSKNYGIVLVDAPQSALTPQSGTVNFVGTDAAETVAGSNSDDVIDGKNGDDTLYGFAGNDTLKGDWGNDTLNGGEGNDTLSGAIGSDTYLIALGDGQDVVSDAASSTDVNVIEFGAGIAKESIGFAKSSNGLDLILTVGSSGQTVTLQYFYGNGYDASKPVISEIRFANGDRWDRNYLLSVIPAAITQSNDWVYGGVANDSISTLGGNDIVWSGAGDDVVSGNDGSDQLYGEAGNDTLVGGAGNDSLTGGDGDDTFVFVNGDGADYVTGGSGVNRLNINGTVVTGAFNETGYQSGVYADTAGNRFSINSSGLMTVTYGTGAQQSTVTIWDWNASTNNFGFTLVAASQPAPQPVPPPGATPVNITGTDSDESFAGSDGADTIDGKKGNDTLYGFGGNDTLKGDWGNDVLYGGAGDDNLDGFIGNDILVGGLGNDTMSGSIGSDTYRIAAGDGLDSITDSRSTSDINVIEFGTGIAKQDIWFSKSSNGLDLVVNIANTGQSVSLKYFYDTTYNASNPTISEIRFENGDRLTKAELINLIPVLITNSNDWVYGGTGNDSVSALAGNDVVWSGAGDDIVSGNEGNDQLYGEAGNDTLVGGEGGDTLSGGAGNDTLISNGGTDFFFGGTGDDTFNVNRGGGTDYVMYTAADNNNQHTDKLVMADNISQSEIWFKQSGSYLYMYLLGSSDKVIIDKWSDATVSTDNRVVDRVEANGYYLDTAAIDQLVGAMASFGTVNYASPNFTSQQQATVDAMLANAWKPIA